MKKSLIALAALSTIAGSVAAQSSVTIYGRINPGVGALELKDAAGKRTETNGYQVNGWTSSRLGVNISEDLGAGQKAVGVWETNIATEGASTGTVRQAFAGLQGGFGQVTIGNQYTPEYTQGITVAGTVNSYGFGGAALSQTATVKKTNTSVHRLGTVDSGNVIAYVAPKMGNVTLSGFYGKSASEVTNASGAALETDTNSTIYGLAANLKAGALDATLSYSQSKADNLAVTGDYITTTFTSNTVAASTDIDRTTSCTASATVACTTITAAVDAANTKQKNWTANATYTLGDAKLFAYYADREMTGTTALDYAAYNLGVQYTIGKFTPFAQMSNGKMKNAAGTTINDLSSTQVGVTYAFSKRTTGYAYVAEYKDDVALSYAGAAATANSKKATATSVGIAHNF
jgi:predicted porin